MHHAYTVVAGTIIIGQMFLHDEAQFVIKINGFLVFGMDFQEYSLCSVCCKRMEDMIGQFMPDALALCIGMNGYSIKPAGLVLAVMPQ